MSISVEQIDQFGGKKEWRLLAAKGRKGYSALQKWYDMTIKI